MSPRVSLNQKPSSKCLKKYPKIIFKMSQIVSQKHLQNVFKCIPKQFSKLSQKDPKIIFKMCPDVSLNHLQNDIRCSPKTIFKMAPDVSQSHHQNTKNSTTSTPKPFSKFHQMYSKTILKMAKWSFLGWSYTVLLKPCLLFSIWTMVYAR